MGKHSHDELVVVGRESVPDDPGELCRLRCPHCRLPLVAPSLVSKSPVGFVIFGQGADDQGEKLFDFRSFGTGLVGPVLAEA